MKVCTFVRFAALLVCLAVFPTSGRTQDQYAVGDLGQTVTISEATFRQMNEDIQALKASFAENKKDEKKDEWTDTSGEKWTVKWGGRVHGDFVTFPRQNLVSQQALGAAIPVTAGGPLASYDEQNYWQVRRLRFEAEGEGYGVFYWRTEVDFQPIIPQDAQSSGAAGGTLTTGSGFVNMRDVYMGVKELPFFGAVQIGNYKAPFSLEELTGDSLVTFMERGMFNTAFVASRQLGICSFNISASENATWAYGAFFDTTDQTTKMREADNLGCQFVGRATWLPYYDEPSNGRYLLHTGIGYRYEDRYSTPTSSGGPTQPNITFRSRPEDNGEERTISTGSIDGNDINYLDLELAAVYGSLSLQGELIGSTMTVASTGLARTKGNVHPYYNGGYLMASYFLTGESRPYKKSRGVFDRVSPLENFWCVRGAGCGTGAWEVAGRWSWLDLSGTTFATSGYENNFTCGANWYWNPNMRMMFEYIHAETDYTNSRPAGKLGTLDLLGCRAQFDW
ncbi:MAG: porin [Planctomycetota bacterium]|nr:porin [Planctomycetota bacterium]